MKVGQKIWLVRKRDGEPEEVTVEAVGRKYFTIENHIERFFLKNLCCESNFRWASDRCYLSLQDILDEKEQEILMGKVQKALQAHQPSLEDLRGILNILEKNPPKS